MKTLLLMRHAEALPQANGQEDHDRALSPSGKTVAGAVGRWLSAERLMPDIILCSTSVRTRETLAALSESIGERDTRFEKKLYCAPAGELLAQVNGIDERHSVALIIAHNPGIPRFASLLMSSDGRADANAALRDFPPAGLVHLSLRVQQWSEVEPGRGALLQVKLPD
ncbi:MAG: histidine phosphatase family protein [Alphaproteobacteria bacterium]|nr:histidine phosphatase family protein [Alphaproteobacteria bacterium]